MTWSNQDNLGPPWMTWGVAGRALAGEAVSGDQHVVELFPNGALVAVVDGLGHGAKAAAAAEAAVVILKAYAHEPVASLLERCHEELKKTRGAVISLASFNTLDGTMTWLGVGNVEGVLIRSDVAASSKHQGLLLRGGVVGYQLPPLRAAIVPVARGDTLILATDGIRSNFAERLPLSDPPQSIADHILAQHGKKTDDALVLVTCYLGYA